MYVCMYIYVCVCMYIRIIYVIDICVYVYMYICINMQNMSLKIPRKSRFKAHQWRYRCKDGFLSVKPVFRDKMGHIRDIIVY